MSSKVVGAIINILSFSRSHVKSLEEGLWGFPDDKQRINKRRWSALRPGITTLIYGENKGRRGIWLRATLREKFHSQDPVAYWGKSPTGFPYQVRLNLENASPQERNPLTKEELATFGLGLARQKLDRWSLVVFGDPQPGVTYRVTLFQKISDEFEARNVKPILTVKPTHDEIQDMIYQMGVLQGSFPLKEFTLEDGRRMDVVWRRTAKSSPNWAFEVQIGGNIVEALAKLKHVYDLHNSIPVLIATEDQISEAHSLLGGAFHEIKHVIRVLPDTKLIEFYKMKLQLKDLKNEFGIV